MTFIKLRRRIKTREENNFYSNNKHQKDEYLFFSFRLVMHWYLKLVTLDLDYPCGNDTILSLYNLSRLCILAHLKFIATLIKWLATNSRRGRGLKRVRYRLVKFRVAQLKIKNLIVIVFIMLEICI